MQRKRKKYSSDFVQLATIGLYNSPRVRTVVFRGWSDFELNSNNNAEICWYFSKTKCQFSFRGKSLLDFGKDYSHHWDKLDEQSKSMLNWPAPGEIYYKNKLKIEIYY